MVILHEITPAPEGAAGGDLCPVCQSTDSSPWMLLRSPSRELQDLDLSRCRACGSAFYTTENPVSGYLAEHKTPVPRDAFWTRYVQSDAGISSMLENLFALGKGLRGSFLDVGCGFGFAVDFWQTFVSSEALGLEQASYGSKGAELLGYHLKKLSLADYVNTSGDKHDVILCSEVIEHVQDPLEFAKQLHAALTPDGVLILSTPSVVCLLQNSDSPGLLQALSPGFHYFVLSESALHTLLTNSGFSNVRIHDTGTTLVAWASDAPLPDPNGHAFRWDLYFGYLEKLAGNSNPHVRSGALYRLLKDSINTGNDPLATKYFPLFLECAKTDFGLDLLNPESCRFLEVEDPLDQLEKYPAWLPCGLFFCGLALEKFTQDQNRACRMIRTSQRFMEHAVLIGKTFAVESVHFLPYARISQVRLLGTLLEEQMLHLTRTPPRDPFMKDLFQICCRKLKSLDPLWSDNVPDSLQRSSDGDIEI